MPKVEFVVAGSPNEAFLSQIAANRTSVFRQTWTRWQASYRCILGGEPDPAALSIWMPLLTDIDIEFLSMERFERDGYFAQSERRLSLSRDGADVIVLLDADTIVTGDLETVLDLVHEKKSIAGVQAHVGFPTGEGTRSTTTDWQTLADAVLNKQVRFPFAYSLMPQDAPEEERAAPFYINAGAVFLSSEVQPQFTATYHRLRRLVTPHLLKPYFAGQIAITLAVEDLGLDPISLPMRYNFPNDAEADVMYPEELADVRLIHFLRFAEFDRKAIFSNESSYQEFLAQPLTGSNRVFQTKVRELLGAEYPFGDRMKMIWKVISELRENNDIRVVNKAFDDKRRRKIEENSKKLKDRNAEIKALKLGRYTDRKNLEEAVAAVARLEARIEDLQSRNNAVTEERDRLENENEMARQRLGASQLRIAALEQDVEKVRSALDPVFSNSLLRLSGAVRRAKAQIQQRHDAAEDDC